MPTSYRNNIVINYLAEIAMDAILLTTQIKTVKQRITQHKSDCQLGKNHVR